MEHTGAEPRLSAYLHARACAKGIPLAGTFELTARCNFNCRMCYVHLTPEEQRRRGASAGAGARAELLQGPGRARQRRSPPPPAVPREGEGVPPPKAADHPGREPL